MGSALHSAVAALPSKHSSAFVVLFVVTTALFVPTLIGYTSFDKVKDTEIGVKEVALDGEDTLAVTYTIRNPTASPVTLTHVTPYVRSNATLVNDFADVDVPETTIKPGETVTVTARTTISDDDTAMAYEAVDNGTVTVFSRVTIAVNGQKQTVSVEATGVQ